MTFTRALATNNYGTAKFIVDGTTTANGTHSTITAALTSASSGDTIFIRPGTYTENLTLKAGVNIAAYECDAQRPNVTIVGKMSASFSGKACLSGLMFQTNSDYILEMTGASATVVNAMDCFFNCTNNTGINSTNSNASSRLELRYCNGDITALGITFFTFNCSHGMEVFSCKINNTGGSTTASTYSGSSTDLSFRYCSIAFLISTSGATATLGMRHCVMDISGSTLVTIDSTNTPNRIFYCYLASGTASAISVGAGATLELYHNTIASNNTNTVTGAGTITYGNLVMAGTSSVMNTTTQSPVYTHLGKWKASGQPAFLAYQAADQTNATGAGTTYTLGSTTDLTEVFDVGGDFTASTGTFTAPVTGKYFLECMIQIEALTVAMTNVDARIVTSNRSYELMRVNPAICQDNNATIDIGRSTVADMDAGDTATYTVIVANGVGDTATIGGSTVMVTSVSGQLIS